MRRPSQGRQGTGSTTSLQRIRVLHRSDCGHLPKVEAENPETGEIQVIPDYAAIARYYAEAVASKRLPTNTLLVQAAQRYLDMLEMADDPDCDFYFSPEHLSHFCMFSETMRHFEGGNYESTQRDPVTGDVDATIYLEPFEIWIEANAQGFRRRFNDARLFTTVVEIVPRKHGKSLRGTRAALYELCVGGVRGAEIPVAARDAEQAKKTLFGDIQKMVNEDEDLRNRYELTVVKNEVRGPNGSIFPLTGLSDKIDGLNPSLSLFDEAHAGSSKVYEVVESAFGARPGQQMRVISTAGQRPEGPAFELIKKAKMVLDGTVEDYTFFAAIYTLDPDDYLHPETKMIMWERLLTSEELIMKCNPMYGVSLDPMSVKSKVKDALKASPQKRGEIARTRFNIWSGAGTTLIDTGHWSNCYEKNLDLDSFIGERCWIGVDLASYHDMCAIALLFEMPNDMLAIFAELYLPEDSSTAMAPEIADYISMWGESGKLHLTPGSLADHDLVRLHVENFCELFDVQVIACDPAQAHNTVKHLYDGNKPVVVFPNNAKTMTAPTDDLLGRIETRRILHDGNPVLSWHVQNVHGDRSPNGQIIPRKDKQGSHRKIDGFVAAVFANGCRMNPEDAKAVGEATSAGNDPYQTRGLIGADDL